jgi:exopolysaccharide production protein ExoQ
MPKPALHSLNFRVTRSSTRTIDKYTLVAVLACAYAIIDPFILTGGSPPDIIVANVQNAEPSLVGRIFIPAIAAVSIAFALANYSRLTRVTWPPHLICLFAYAAFAGASVLWAFRPEASFVRFAQQIMVLSSIVLPAMLVAPTADLMRGMFLCFAVGAILNIFFGHQNPDGTYSGYFTHKNELGAFSGIALLLALHETLYPGLRRVFGLTIVVTATLLLLWSQSKTAFALALICPLLAGLIWIIRKVARVSPAITVVSVLVCYAAVSSVSSFNIDVLTAVMYGDTTFTDRTVVWDFVFSEIARRPLFGWGYRSFWLVGLDAPSVVEAPVPWVAMMPNAHNGYYETILDLGYTGLALLLLFVFATLHAMGRVVDRNRGRAWLLLSLALYVIIYNCLETIWMQGNSPTWMVFVIVAAEVGRYSQTFAPMVARAQARNSAVRGVPLGGGVLP